MGTLYLVATPIGNLEDVSVRARRTLAAVDVVAAEDTRRTGRLLSGLGISAKLVSFFEGNERSRIPGLVELIGRGGDVALVTDGGMPSISDPGYRLVAACVEAGLAVDVVPGPSAALAALAVSGLPTDRFVFEGFLPRAGGARRERLVALAAEPRTAIVFESARRLAGTLAELTAACGEVRRVAVCRELTKLNQEVLRGSLGDVETEIRGRERVRGEVVVVLEGARAAPVGVEEAVRYARDLVRSGRRRRDAARAAAAVSGVPSREVYQALVEGPHPTIAGS